MADSDNDIINNGISKINIYIYIKVYKKKKKLILMYYFIV